MKKIRKTVSLILAAILICSAVPAALAAPYRESVTVQQSQMKLALNGSEPVRLCAYTINDSNYLKLRDIAYILMGTEAGFSVGWNEEENTAEIVRGGKYEPVGGECTLPAEPYAAQAIHTDCVIMLDGLKFDAEAYMIEDNNYFRLRDLLYQLDVNVRWDEAAQTAVLDTSKPYISEWKTAPAQQLLTSEQVAEKAESTVEIFVYDDQDEQTSQGSGFFISGDGLIASCYHIFAEGIKAKIVCDDGAVYEITEVVAYNQPYDTIILRADTKGKSYEPILFGDSTTLRRGQRIMAIGSPQDEINTVSEGIISAMRRDPKGLRSELALDIQVSAPISKGSSGGPLLDMYGHAVGTIYAAHNFGENMNYAIPSEEFLMTLDFQNPVPYSVFAERVAAEAEAKAEAEAEAEEDETEEDETTSASVSYIH